MLLPARTGSGSSLLVVTSRSRLQVTCSVPTALVTLQPLAFVAMRRYCLPSSPAGGAPATVAGVVYDELVAPPTFDQVAPLSVESCHWNGVAPPVPDTVALHCAVAPGHTVFEVTSLVIVGAAFGVTTTGVELTLQTPSVRVRFTEKATDGALKMMPFPIAADAVAAVVAPPPLKLTVGALV